MLGVKTTLKNLILSIGVSVVLMYGILLVGVGLISLAKRGMGPQALPVPGIKPVEFHPRRSSTVVGHGAFQGIETNNLVNISWGLEKVGPDKFRLKYRIHNKSDVSYGLVAVSFDVFDLKGNRILVVPLWAWNVPAGGSTTVETVLQNGNVYSAQIRRAYTVVVVE
jgi:hypothetical protein